MEGFQDRSKTYKVGSGQVLWKILFPLISHWQQGQKLLEASTTIGKDLKANFAASCKQCMHGNLVVTVIFLLSPATLSQNRCLQLFESRLKKNEELQIVFYYLQLQ